VAVPALDDFVVLIPLPRLDDVWAVAVDAAFEGGADQRSAVGLAHGWVAFSGLGRRAWHGVSEGARRGASWLSAGASWPRMTGALCFPSSWHGAGG